MLRTRTLVKAVIAAAAAVLGIQFAIFGFAGQAYAADEAADANPTLTIAHFAPFASEVISTSVTVRVVGVGDVLTDFQFGEIKTGITALPAGTYTIEIVQTGKVTPAIVDSVTIVDDMNYTVAAIGNGTDQPLELQVYVDDQTPPAAGESHVNIRHLAPFANSVAGTAVDLCAAESTPLETDFQYKEGIEAKLKTGIYTDVFIAATGNNCSEASKILSVPVFAARVGAISYVYAVGDVTNLPLQIAQTGLQARVAVSHFAPFASSVAGTSVSVTLGGSEIVSDFVFGERWPDASLSYTDVAIGDYAVEVTPTGQAQPAIAGTAVVSGFVDYTFAAIGDNNLQPLELVRLIDDNTTPAPSGQARVRVGHYAPFADTPAGTTVDICTSLNGAPLLNDVPYKAYASRDLPAATYDSVFIGKADPDCSQVVLPIPTFILSEGSPAYLYAIGDGSNIDITATATPLSVVAARVAVAHLAPFADTAQGTSVDVKLNGNEVLTGFTYPQITPYLTVPSGEYKVEIFPSGGSVNASDPAISGTATLAPVMDYTVAAIGDGSNQPLELLQLTDDNSIPPAGKGRARVAHLAPFADTLAGTTVDLCTAVNGQPLVNDFQYKAGGTLELGPGFYSSVFIGKASPDCSEVILSVPPFFVKEGGSGSLFAIGDGANFPVSVTSPPPGILAEILHLPVISKQRE